MSVARAVPAAAVSAPREHEAEWQIADTIGNNLRGLLEGGHSLSELTAVLDEAERELGAIRDKLARKANPVLEKAIFDLMNDCSEWRSHLCPDKPPEDRVNWEEVCRHEGVPLVAGSNRNRKRDYAILAPMVVGKARISQVLCKAEGATPTISEADFNSLLEVDPWDGEHFIAENYVLVVPPEVFKRATGPDYHLNSQGNLVRPPVLRIDERGVLALPPQRSPGDASRVVSIPFGLRNLTVLCKNPLKRTHMPVFAFSKGPGDEDGVLGTYDSQVSRGLREESRIWLMRKQGVNGSSFKYADQVETLRAQRFTTTPTSIRALSNAVEILESGQCPDVHSDRFARTDHYSHHSHAGIGSDHEAFMAMGNFKRKEGVQIRSFHKPGYYADEYSRLPTGQLMRSSVFKFYPDYVVPGRPLKNN